MDKVETILLLALIALIVVVFFKLRAIKKDLEIVIAMTDSVSHAIAEAHRSSLLISHQLDSILFAKDQPIELGRV